MIKKYMTLARESIKKNFKHATLNFAFIILFVNVFQAAFGPENSIVGVIFTIMMSASMVRDMTAAPFKHLLIQALVLVMMAVSACFAAYLPPLAALPINLVTLVIILYAFTYEYSSHMYFPYILSYLFLVFISPVGPAELPKRLLGMMVGAVCIILYQLFNGRKRVKETARDVLTSIIDEAAGYIGYLRGNGGKIADGEEIHRLVCKLSRTVYDRRKKTLCVSDASFAMIDAGRGLENLIIFMGKLEGAMNSSRERALKSAGECLENYRSYLQMERDDVEAPNKSAFEADDAVIKDMYSCLNFISDNLKHMTDPEKRAYYRKTALSVKVRLKAALDISPVRVVYAVRVSVLIAAFVMLVQYLNLSYGKWLVFTVASLSLPYADDVGAKTRKRIIATIAGGLISVAAYALIPSAAGRTAVMMLSGYVSFYFSDYAGMFTCSTIGALGGAAFINYFGWADMLTIFLIRVFFVLMGAAIALLANRAIWPFTRSKATRLLLKKYSATTDLLARVCATGNADMQLYYSLVIQAHLQESKLAENATAEGLEGMSAFLEQCRSKIRQAHRSLPKRSNPTLAV